MLRRAPRRLCTKQTVQEAYASTGSSMRGEPKHRTSVRLSIERKRSGALLEALAPFEKHGVNLAFISSVPVPYETKAKYVSINVDVSMLESDERFQAAFAEVKRKFPLVNVTGSYTIPWFPHHAADLDNLDQSTLAAGADLMDDPENPHPGFHDQEYRNRRKLITENAMKFRYGDEVPYVDYSAEENACWSVVWDKLTGMHASHACKQFNNIFPTLVEHGIYSRDRVPQLNEVSDFLKDATGFQVRPVAGLLSSRDFLNALAFRTFFSTQYIRHPSKPLYTPEPDVCHELMGHAPLFADPNFADFSQQLGLLSLGAPDSDVTKLARCYWYTVEFGLLKQANGVRAYGAGLLSSFGELEYSLSDKPRVLPWDPYVASELDFPITTYQPTYFVAESFPDMRAKLVAFAESLEQPFRIEYNAASGRVKTWPRLE